jgi:uncharacterized protein YegP (UPF0339 family)
MAFGLTSCTLFDYSYVATPLNTADVNKKGDLHLDAYIPFSRFNVQASYAPTNHLGLMADYCAGFRGDVHSLDVGAGYFVKKSKFFFNAYAGLGIASVNMNTSIDGYYETSHLNNQTQYDKLFVQGLIGKQVSEKFKWSLSARLSYVYFNSYAYKHYHDVYKGRASIDSLQLTAPAAAVLINPTLSIELFPERRFSFKLQAGCIIDLYADSKLNDYTVNLSNYPATTYSQGTDFNKQHQPVYFPLTLHAGVRLNLNRGKQD